jgi:hypothetical protein
VGTVRRYREWASRLRSFRAAPTACGSKVGPSGRFFLFLRMVGAEGSEPPTLCSQIGLFTYFQRLNGGGWRCKPFRRALRNSCGGAKVGLPKTPGISHLTRWFFGRGPTSHSCPRQSATPMLPQDAAKLDQQFGDLRSPGRSRYSMPIIRR